uniref:Ovule protein n=1 Tax=Rhabditophanes sp. KR3021 TaxID=114890 RepID=A0AC35UDQ0_9BILA
MKKKREDMTMRYWPLEQMASFMMNNPFYCDPFRQNQMLSFLNKQPFPPQVGMNLNGPQPGMSQPFWPNPIFQYGNNNALLPTLNNKTDHVPDA